MAAYNLLPGAIVEVIDWQILNGQTLLNTLHFRLDAPSSISDGPGEVDALVAKLYTPAGANQIIDAVLDAQSQDILHQFATGQVVYQTRRPQQTFTLNQSGLTALTAMPQNVAAVVTKLSALPGRGRSGSYHLGGLPSNAVVQGSLSAAFQTKMDNLAARLKLNIPALTVGASWLPVMFSAATPENTQLIFDTYAQVTSRVMRRRTVRVGI